MVVSQVAGMPVIVSVKANNGNVDDDTDAEKLCTKVRSFVPPCGQAVALEATTRTLPMGPCFSFLSSIRVWYVHQRPRANVGHAVPHH